MFSLNVKCFSQTEKTYFLFYLSLLKIQKTNSEEARSVLQESKNSLRRSKRIMKSDKKQSKRIKHTKKSPIRPERMQSNQKLVKKKRKQNPYGNQRSLIPQPINNRLLWV